MYAEMQKCIYGLRREDYHYKKNLSECNNAIDVIVKMNIYAIKALARFLLIYNIRNTYFKIFYSKRRG